MTKSFDEWWSECKKNGFVPTFSDVASNAFKAGQQSKQAEVDELQLKLSEDSRVLHNVIDIERKKCEELQKRIDEAMKMLAHGEGYGYEQCTRLAINILKGDSHES